MFPITFGIHYAIGRSFAMGYNPNVDYENCSTGPRFHSAPLHRLKSSKTRCPGDVSAKAFAMSHQPARRASGPCRNFRPHSAPKFSPTFGRFGQADGRTPARHPPGDGPRLPGREKSEQLRSRILPKSTRHSVPFQRRAVNFSTSPRLHSAPLHRPRALILDFIHSPWLIHYPSLRLSISPLKLAVRDGNSQRCAFVRC